MALAGADAFFQLGMMYSIGRSVPVDLVSAHKWFNIAALRGEHEAVRLRQEVADQMSEQDSTAAQARGPRLADRALRSVEQGRCSRL